MLEVAAGVKELLIAAGFTSIDPVLCSSSTAEIIIILGIEFYVAKIITDAARKAAKKY
jgi:hypothetical protein